MPSENSFPCGKDGCNAPISKIGGDVFVRCSQCDTVNCVSCMAAHQGIDCKTYQVLNKKKKEDRLKRDTLAKSCINEKEGTMLDRDQNGSVADVQVHCRNAECGVIFSAKANTKLVPCVLCSTVTCTECDAVHEGARCKQKVQSDGSSSRKTNTDDPDICNGDSNQLLYGNQDGYRDPQEGFGLTGHSDMRKGAKIETTEQMYNSGLQAIFLQKVEEEEDIEANCPSCNAILFITKKLHKVTCNFCQQQFCSECRIDHDGKTCAEYMETLKNYPRQQELNENGGDLSAKINDGKIEASCPSCKAILFIKREIHIVSCNFCKSQFCSECRTYHAGRSCADVIEKIQDDAKSQDKRENVMVPGLPAFDSHQCPRCRLSNHIPAPAVYVKCMACPNMFCKFCGSDHSTFICEESKFMQNVTLHPVMCKNCRNENYIPIDVYSWRCHACYWTFELNSSSQHNDRTTRQGENQKSSGFIKKICAASKKFASGVKEMFVPNYWMQCPNNKCNIWYDYREDSKAEIQCPYCKVVVCTRCWLAHGEIPCEVLAPPTDHKEGVVV